jgi:fumarate reductase flavoprotein subunit
VANSTVFGGIAGDVMADWVRREGAWREPDAAALAAAVAACEAPFGRPAGDVEAVREALYECMWRDVGILRTAQSLQGALHTLDELEVQLARTGVAAGERGFHMGWHDWLNLHSLISVSRVITHAALAREDSCGAHFREDFAAPTAAAGASHIVVQQRGGGALELQRAPVRFTRVAPGQSLLAVRAAAR